MQYKITVKAHQKFKLEFKQFVLHKTKRRIFTSEDNVRENFEIKMNIQREIKLRQIK